jgi:hypothetical protein
MAYPPAAIREVPTGRCAKVLLLVPVRTRAPLSSSSTSAIQMPSER